MAAAVRCNGWFGLTPAQTPDRSIALVHLRHLPVHEDPVRVRLQPAHEDGPLVFDCYLMSLPLANGERVPLHPLEIKVGGQTGRFYECDLLAVRRYPHGPDPWVAVELDASRFDITEFEGESHAPPLKLVVIMNAAHQTLFAPQGNRFAWKPNDCVHLPGRL